MIVRSEFKVDLFQLKHTKDPEGMVAAYKASYARELGVQLEKLFPYTKDEANSFAGTLPEMSLNKDHEFVDRYRSEFVVLSRGDIQELKRLVDVYISDGRGYVQIMTILNS